MEAMAHSSLPHFDQVRIGKPQRRILERGQTLTLRSQCVGWQSIRLTSGLHDDLIRRLVLPEYEGHADEAASVRNSNLEHAPVFRRRQQGDETRHRKIRVRQCVAGLIQHSTGREREALGPAQHLRAFSFRQGREQCVALSARHPAHHASIRRSGCA